VCGGHAPLLRAFMRRSLSIPAAGLGFALVTLSVLANFCFGYLLTDTPERFLYAFLFAVLDASKAFLLPIRDALREDGHARKAKCAGAAFWVFAVSSFVCEVGLYKIVKGRAAGETSTAAAAVDATDKSKNAAEAALKDLKLSGTYFPVIDLKTANLPTIDLTIQNAELHDLWRRSGSCKDVTKDDSRVFCKDHNTLVAARKSRETIENYHADLQTKEGKETRKQADKKDEQAVVFARWLHVTTETVSDLLACVVAFLIEAGSVLLPWFAFSPRNRQEPAVPAVSTHVLDAPAVSAAPTEADAADQCELAAQRWYDACVIRRRGGFVSAAELGDNHLALCERPFVIARRPSEVDKTRLGKFMRARGFTGIKKGGSIRYEGIALAPVPGRHPHLRVAADNTKARHQMVPRNNASAVAAVGAVAPGAARRRRSPGAPFSSTSPLA
jgi:hypothetical protein